MGPDILTTNCPNCDHHNPFLKAVSQNEKQLFFSDLRQALRQSDNFVYLINLNIRVLIKDSEYVQFYTRM